jgi:hypothetical protein
MFMLPFNIWNDGGNFLLPILPLDVLIISSFAVIFGILILLARDYCRGLYRRAIWKKLQTVSIKPQSFVLSGGKNTIVITGRDSENKVYVLRLKCPSFSRASDIFTSFSEFIENGNEEVTVRCLLKAKGALRQEGDVYGLMLPDHMAWGVIL